MHILIITAIIIVVLLIIMLVWAVLSPQPALKQGTTTQTTVTSPPPYGVPASPPTQPAPGVRQCPSGSTLNDSRCLTNCKPGETDLGTQCQMPEDKIMRTAVGAPFISKFLSDPSNYFQVQAFKCPDGYTEKIIIPGRLKNCYWCPDPSTKLDTNAWQCVKPDCPAGYTTSPTECTRPATTYPKRAV